MFGKARDRSVAGFLSGTFLLTVADVVHDISALSSSRSAYVQAPRFVEKHVGVDDVGAAAEQLYENFQLAVRRLAERASRLCEGALRA